MMTGEKGGASGEKVGEVLTVVEGGGVHVIVEEVGFGVVEGVTVVEVGSLRGRPRPYRSQIGLGLGLLTMVGENVGESGEKVGIVVVVSVLRW